MDGYTSTINPLYNIKNNDKRVNGNSKKEIGVKQVELLINNKTQEPRTRHRISPSYLLGADVIIDDALKWRVKWAQIGIALSALFGMIFFVIADAIKNNIMMVIGLTFAGICLLCFIMLLYKNVSLTIMKRLLKEPNVIIIITYGICELVVNIVKPTNALSPINGGIFFLVVIAMVFIDSVKLKSRVMVIIFFSIFTFLMIWNIYDNTIGTNAIGVKLMSYTIQGQEMVIWKRSMKRNSYVQILLFSMSAIWTMIKDKKMEFMMFGTSHIYRATGTTSKSVIDEQFIFKAKA